MSEHQKTEMQFKMPPAPGGSLGTSIFSAITAIPVYVRNFRTRRKILSLPAEREVQFGILAVVIAHALYLLPFLS
jgi:hypothetical protein